MKVTIKDIILLVIIAVMAFFIFDGCQAKKRVLQQSESLASYTDSISFYKSKSDELIASNETLVITSASQVSGLKEELENLRLKKPRTVIKYKNRVEIKEVEVAIDIPCEDFSLPFVVDSTYYNIGGVITNNSLKFDSVVIPNKQSIYVAELKEKWYKSPSKSVVITNSNPLIESVGLESFIIKDEKKFYQKPAFLIGVGFAAGLVTLNYFK